MDAYEAITKRRAIRQFRQDKIEYDLLLKIAEAGKLAPSGMNLQPLHFFVATEPDMNKQIFGELKWAGYLEGWTPPEDKRPVAYILIAVDPSVRDSGYEYDVGLAAENLMIAATASGLGSCPLAIPDSKKIAGALKAPPEYIFCLAVALGHPDEVSQAEEMDTSVRYWRSEDGTLHVPKRKSSSVIHMR